jgi:aryl-alcohol dehydrogenase-like predicted oxidoreductase
MSLESLRTGHVDLYMLHRDNPVVPVGRILERMNRVIEDGYAGAIGASNWAYARVDEANAYAREHGLQGFTFVSNNLSLAVPSEPFYPRLVSVDTEGELWHERTGIPLLSWSSQARGFFAGRYTAVLRAQPDGLASPFDRRMMEVYGNEANFERLRRAKELGEAQGDYTAVEVALAWLLRKPYPLVPIVGPRTRDEMASSIRAVGLPLNDADCRWLNLED